MGVIFALNGLSYLLVALMAFYIYYTFCKKGELACKVGDIMGANGIFYLLMSFLNFLWTFGVLEPSNKDFALMNFVLVIVSSLLILYAVYKITDNRNLVYLLVLFISTVFAINYSIQAFFVVTLAASYLLMIIVSLELILFSNFYLKNAGYSGVAYVILSVAMSALAFYGVEAINLFWFLPNIAMFFALLFICLDVKNLGIIRRIERKRYKKVKAWDYLGLFSKFFVFMASISAFIFVSSIAIHELGHAFVAQYYGCGQFKAVIYDIIAPHTEIKCDVYYNDFVLTAAGIAATTTIGLLFILTGGAFIRGISYLIFGFGLLISYGDLVELQVSKNIIYVTMLLSVIIITIAIVKISAYNLKQQNILKERVESSDKTPVSSVETKKQSK
ncbi:hypothetical protein HYY70_03985 [Candidatus Woesearchaeota archaeon]|nr:hypothetical protein [Candidatus Woesearchaeota archaeon]